MYDEKKVKMLTIWLIEGSRGGKTRARILMALKKSPANPHQLAKRLGLNYRTITHHLKVLEDHGLVRRIHNSYGAPYTLSEAAEKYWKIIEQSICKVLGDEC